MTEHDEQATDLDPNESAPEGEHEPGGSEEPEGPVDQLGIPMSREPTLDDVRTDGEEHRRLALGCTVLVIAALAGFWLFRVVLAG